MKTSPASSPSLKLLAVAALSACATSALANTVTGIETYGSPPYKAGQTIPVVVKGDAKCGVTINDGAGKTWDIALTDPSTPPSKQLGVTYAQPGTYVLSAKGKAPCTGQVQKTVVVEGPKLISFAVTAAGPHKVEKPILALVKGEAVCGVTINDGAGKSWDIALTDGNTNSKVFGFVYAKAGTFNATATAKSPCQGSLDTTITVTQDMVVAAAAASVPVINLPANPCPEGWSLVAGSKTSSGAFTCKPSKPAAKTCPPKHEWFDDGCTAGCKQIIY
jgi:hypothetical protein